MLIVFNTPHISLSLSPPTLPPYLKLQGKRGLSEIWRDRTSISVFVCLVCLAHKLFLLISFPFYVPLFTSKNESSIFGKYGKLFNFVPRGVCRFCVCEDIYENNWYDNAEPRRCKEGDYVVPSISNFFEAHVLIFGIVKFSKVHDFITQVLMTRGSGLSTSKKYFARRFVSRSFSFPFSQACSSLFGKIFMKIKRKMCFSFFPSDADVEK